MAVSSAAVPFLLAQGANAGNGTIHARSFGLVNSRVIDQFDKLDAAIRHCVEQRITLDISGLEIRIAKQLTSDRIYSFVSNKTFRNAGVPITYAFKIGANGWLRLVGNGTIGNLTPNSSQTIFHAEDAEYIEIGDGVTLDAWKTDANDHARACHLMGVQQVHLGRCTFYRDDSCMMGASPNRMTQLCTFTDPSFVDGRGTHSLGGKPGGCREWRGNSLQFLRCRGGWSLECEDVDGFNDNGNGSPLWDDKLIATANAVVANGLDASLGRHALLTAADTVLVQDSRGAEVSIGSITTIGAVSTSGNAACLYVGAGQSDRPAASIKVGHIHCDGGLQAVRCTTGRVGGEIISIDRITGPSMATVLDVTTSGGNGFSGQPAKIKSISIGEVRVDSIAREGFFVRNTSNGPGTIVERLDLGTVRFGTCRWSAMAIKDTDEVVIGDISYTRVQELRRGNFYEGYGFYIKARSLQVKNHWRHGGSYASGGYLEIADRAEIVGLELDGTDKGAGVVVSGNGSVAFRAGEFRGAANGVAVQRGGGSPRITFEGTRRNGLAVNVPSTLD